MGYKKRFAAVLSVFSIILSGCGKADYSGVNEILTENAEHIEFVSDVDEYLSGSMFSGSVLVAKNGEILFAKGYGLSDKKKADSEKNTIHSTYEIGSMTKQMTAACILQLWEKDLLSIDDKISKYFPEYMNGEKITIEMLLHMRSGLQDPINDPHKFFPAEVADYLLEAEYNNQPIENDIVMQYFYDVPLKKEPNTVYDYCNMNYYLLACIIEQVSGMSYTDYMQKNIFDRIDMTETNMSFQNTTTKAYDRMGHYFSIPTPLVKGAGEVNSSVLDIYKWNKALFGGEIFSKPETLEYMLTGIDGYACGLFTEGGTILHGGSTDVFNSFNILYEQDNLMIIMLANIPVDVLNTATYAGNIRRFYKGEI